MAGDPILQRTAELLARLRARGPSSWSAEDLAQWPRLYRRLATLVAEVETQGQDPARARALRRLLEEAHELTAARAERVGPGWLPRVLRFYAADVPRAVRAEWRLIAFSFVLIYGLAGLAYWAVSSNLTLAYSLLPAEAVDTEIEQLMAVAEGEPFRGNFTFGLGQSPRAAGWIMAHNMGVGVLFFAAGLLPPFFLYIMASNGLMVGTYTAVAGHWGQAGAISSILWCHGVLEIQAFVLAAAAGLVLVRAWIAPGPWTRGQALVFEGQRSWKLMAPVFPMLFAAGMIEAFVTPHVPLGARLATAVASGVLLLAWILLGGRRASAAVPQ